MDSKELTQFYQRLLSSLEGTISPQDYQTLISQVKGDKEAAACYVEFLSIYTNLSYSSEINIDLRISENPVGNGDDVENFDSAVWKALLETERTAPPVLIEKPVEKPLVQPVHYELSPRKINRLSVYTAALTSAALIAIILFFQFAPVPAAQEVATVTGLVNVDWGNTPHAMSKGTRLKTNSSPIYLNEGVVGLSYDSGVEVTIEGPAGFRIITPSEIQLEYGRLYSEVSSVGLGFTVQTINSRIIDLGTEFGVQVFPDGATELHVYKGKTALVAGVAAIQKQAIDVSAGQARSVCADGSQVNRVSLKRGYFAEKISGSEAFVWRGQNLSLASLVSGGDGFSEGILRSGIDPASGEIHSEAVQGDNRPGDRRYHAVESRRGIDGVFVPNGQVGANTVSSAGHQFEFPVTDNSYWSDITAYPYVVELISGDAARIDVNGLDIEAAWNSELVFVHSNSGITFDLGKLRRRFPGLEITGFKALCGVGKTRQGFQASEFWVLVDGQEVFHKQHNAELKDAEPVNVAIRPEQQFLTLAVTDGGDENSYDWCAFASPELVLEKQ